MKRQSLPLILLLCLLALGGCEASLAARTPPSARLPAPTSDDPTVNDPGVTGKTPTVPVGSDVARRGPRAGPVAATDRPAPPGRTPIVGTTQPPYRGQRPDLRPRAEPGAPRLAERPDEWPPGGVATGSGPPPIPPPPTWDPTLPSGRLPSSVTSSNAPSRPLGSGPGSTPIPSRPGLAPMELDLDDLPPTGSLPPIGSGTTGKTARKPRTPAAGLPPMERPASTQPPVDTPAGMPPPVKPAGATDDLGAPPGGSGTNPQGSLRVPVEPVPMEPTEPAPAEPVPMEPTEPAPAEPVPMEPTRPAPAEPVPMEPTRPAPAEPVPMEPTRPAAAPAPWDPPEAPSSPEPVPAKPAPAKPAPVESAPGAAGETADPWSTGGAAEPSPAEPTPAAPTPAEPKPVPSGAGEDEDPWAPGGAGDAPPKQPEQPAPAAADDPWEPGGAGEAPPAEPANKGEYVSADSSRRAMEQVTRLLDRPGAKDVCGYPEAIVRADDAGMALTPGTKPVLLVFFDDGVRASDLQAAQLLPMIVRLRDRIDFVPLDRGTGAKRTRGADELALRYLDHVPTVVVLDANRTTRLTRSGRVDAARVEKAILDALANPSEAPAAVPAEPATTKPAPATEGGHAVPASPGEQSPVDPFERPAGGEPKARGGITFTPPAGYSARAHADRLRSAPGEKIVPGYPVELIQSAPAARVLGTGSKPCVILFYDNSSKASDLQAAAYLEMLVRRKSEIDIVLVDVSTEARWDADQKRVVRTFYNFYVPTTVVLTASRAPVKAWYSRVEAAALSKAIDQALQR